VVDDESLILNLIQTALARDGFQVDAISDGEEALKLFRTNRYDLVLCDWKMPGYNGREVYEQIKTINPGAARRVIFMTGDVINENIRSFYEEASLTCLAKPFSMHDLRLVVANAVERTGESSHKPSRE
jgi:DNA-binding response OmpR family regulator